MITHSKAGGRIVELYIPFQFKGKAIEAITLSPVRFGDTIRWGEGAWKSSVELLTELAGVEEAIIRELRYPDADRVMEAFISLLPPEMRDDVATGRVPVPNPEAHQADDVPKLNGGSQQQGPGDPLPADQEAGFDLGEEP